MLEYQLIWKSDYVIWKYFSKIIHEFMARFSALAQTNYF